MSKTLLAAGIVRDIEFDCEDALELYYYALDHRCIEYKELDRYTRADGSVIVRVVSRYNNVDLIEL